jgi:hypothetical protein
LTAPVVTSAFHRTLRLFGGRRFLLLRECAMNNLVCALIAVLAFVNAANAFQCYIDSKGIAEPEPDAAVDKSAFKTFQCNVLKTEPEKVSTKLIRILYQIYILAHVEHRCCCKC